MIFNLPDLILGLGFAVFSGIYFAERLLRRGGWSVELTLMIR